MLFIFGHLLVMTLFHKLASTSSTFSQVCNLLPNLTKLDMTYGIKKCGMEYVRMMVSASARTRCMCA